MEKYVEEFNNFKEAVVFDFDIGDGGIGDYIKFLMIVLTICMKNNKRFYQKINNIELERCIKLKNESLYINEHQISDMEHVVIEKPVHHYNHGTYDGDISPSEVFTFTDLVINNVKSILPSLPDKHISLHLRMGDKFLETEKHHVQCPHDVRGFSDEDINDFLVANEDKSIMFFCDNHSKRLEIKEKYKNVVITDSQIGHTSLRNTNKKQTLDAVTDFYILCSSSRIYTASYSGFSKLASLFNNVPLISLSDWHLWLFQTTAIKKYFLSHDPLYNN